MSNKYKHMDEFKLKIFEKDYPNEILELSTLNCKDTRWITTNILRLGNLSESINDTQLFYNSIVDSLQNEILYEEGMSKYFLQSILNILGISNDSVCFVFWDFEKEVDLLSVKTILSKWDYIWYDTSDEALILYFPGNDKLMLVTDQGFIKTT